VSLDLSQILWQKVFMTSPAYRDHVSGRSPYWRTLKRQRLHAAGWCCESCFRRTWPLDLHHVSYDRVGHESLDDVVVMCRRCHQIEHGKRVGLKGRSRLVRQRLLPFSDARRVR